MLYSARRRLVGAAAASKASQMLETLENRQMLALTMDVRMAGGGSVPALTGVGQTINMEVWGTSTGSNGTGSDDGFQSLLGSILSSDVSGGAARGNLSVSLVSPFNGSGSTPGAQKDLDGDGDLDCGNTDPAANTASGLFMARSNTMVMSGGTLLGNGRSLKIANLSFTVTQLLSGSSTQIRFVPHISSNQFAVNAAWTEDGALRRDGSITDNGVYQSGNAVVLTRAGGGGGGGGGGSTPGSISGSVFKDNNANGTWDAGDSSFPGFQLYIDSNLNGMKDPSEPTTFANGSGNYTFSNLAPNVTYRVRAFPPAGWGTSFPKPPSAWHDVFVGSGQNITGQHFGERPLNVTTSPGSISGTVFKDLNSNGTWDAGDTRFAGFQLYIDSNFNGVKDSNEPTTFADGNGNYFFGSLAPNVTYRVRALPPSGWGTSFPSPNRWHDVFIGSGQNVTGKIFGERPL